jgi:hypothetical protein
MDRVAVFVDAGYLFAQGSVALCGRKRPRADFEFSPERSITSIEAFATAVSGLPLLRVYWYDGSSTGPSMQHLALADLPCVKVRLGYVNSMGEQKGVDSLIVIDMITLARNRAMTDAMLLSGDEDLRVGVQQAQEFGVRVHLLGIRPGRGSQSLFLLQEADTTHEWGPSNLAAFLTLRDDRGSPRDEVVCTRALVPSAEVLDAVVLEVHSEVPDEELRAVVSSIRQQRRIPRELDARLLVSARTRVGRALTVEERRVLRDAFLHECERRTISSRLPGRPSPGSDRASP